MSGSGDDRVKTAVERVLEAAKAFPERPALELPGTTHTYRELLETASGVALSVSELDDPCPYVAVMADKSFSCFAGILGILMAGKAYLPVNPRFPASRSLFMLEKAKIRVIVAGEKADKELDLILEQSVTGIYVIFPGEMEAFSGIKPVSGSQPAYLLFTSGTTGTPKGVSVSHHNLAAYLDFMLNTYSFYPEDRFTQLFDLTFDLSVHDIFLAWSSGACLVVPDDNSSFAMSRFIRDKKPTLWFSVPSVVNVMDRMRLLKPGAFPSLRLSFFCGEALHNRTAQSWKNAASGSGLVNLYGPTEATIAISRYEFPDDPGLWKGEMGIASIGKIFDGNSYRIEKENPFDNQGELFLEGLQVVDGYFENTEADHASFFTDIKTNKKYYRTGDIVKVDEDGDLYFMGRKDAEVKISGYRVNLKEIENLLDGYQPVQQSVVIYDQAEDQAGLLLAFILFKKNQENTEEKDLNLYCRERLPWYMVPGKFIFVNEIPLNINGKTDQAALKKTYLNGK